MNLHPGIPATLAKHLGQKKLPRLDALRAASALIVVLYHFGFIYVPAGLGVMVFFVISGFLITWLLLEEFEKFDRISLRHFYFRRSFRIFPAFYIFWAVTVGGILAKHGHVIWGQAIATFFYLGNYYQGLNHYPESALSHAWSLGVEEQYYLLWPALFLLLVRNGRRLFWVTCACIPVVWIYRAILQVAGVDEAYIYTAFDTRVDHLLVGCGLAIALRYGYFPRFWTAVCARPVYMLLPLSGLILSTAATFVVGVSYRNSFGFMVDPLLVAVLMTQLLASSSHWLAWMESRPVVFLGTISYSTYLYHKLASGLLLRASAGMELPAAILIVSGILAAYLAASVSYFVVEKPFLRWRAQIESKYLLGRLPRRVPS